MALDKAVDSNVLDAGLTSVADAIRTKGGTTADLAFPDGFVSAVNAISTGVNVQKASGRVTTSTKGLATINCGFKPDLVVFFVSTYTSSGDLYENVIVLPIAESKQNSGAALNNIAWASSSGNLIECWPENITSTGISCTFYGYDSSWNEGYASRQTYSWTAVKYTA